MQQQHAPVPDAWPFALLGEEMLVDICATGLCERPGPGLDSDLTVSSAVISIALGNFLIMRGGLRHEDPHPPTAT